MIIFKYLAKLLCLEDTALLAHVLADPLPEQQPIVLCTAETIKLLSDQTHAFLTTLFSKTGEEKKKRRKK